MNIQKPAFNSSITMGGLFVFLLSITVRSSLVGSWPVSRWVKFDVLAVKKTEIRT